MQTDLAAHLERLAAISTMADAFLTDAIRSHNERIAVETQAVVETFLKG